MHAIDKLDGQLSPREILGAPFRGQTYTNLLYLALAFPLGLVYFVSVVVGLSLGVSLAFTLVGIPILIATVLGATLVAGFEARLGATLVGVEAPLPDALEGGFISDADDAVDALKRLFTVPSTWTSVLLLPVKFAFGVFAFAVLVTVSAIVVAMVAAPALYNDPTTTYSVGTYTVETLPVALLVSAAGVGFGLLALTAFNLLAVGGAVINVALLEVGE